MNSMMLLRILRYDEKKLLGMWNRECDNFDIIDEQRKLMFDNLVTFLMWRTGHVKGVALDLSKESMRAKFDFLSVSSSADIPEYAREALRRAYLVVSEHDASVSVLEYAMIAILKVFTRGGVFN